MLFQTTAIQLIHCEIISGSPCSKAKDELPSFIPPYRRAHPAAFFSWMKYYKQTTEAIRDSGQDEAVHQQSPVNHASLESGINGNNQLTVNNEMDFRYRGSSMLLW
ncbi:hypothetical protein FVEG_15610 [Fusarium verticillioides 7600]|uniref:Uncharacterized protein n=1 Tax=Gibberella moniliformis (strain M3125 / FGSC 7600) TaxID=334819 RepID=W7LXL1_GIBM7|nr:hypothetical protein FVEG_15610 [Fusarium verticillioides 7600]EWG44003.1 hypothetical protein FVEG_15610 [Fusarium verticillioides 7600]